MTPKPLFIAGFLVIVSSGSINAAEWNIADTELTTPWAEEVDPTNPLPEYPRLQLRRDDWLNLNGLWEYQKADELSKPPFRQKLEERILVPFAVEAPLSGIMRWDTRMWYRRTFEIPPEWDGRRVMIHFEAVDWDARVYLNGELLGTHKGGFDRFSFDLTERLRGGRNELIVGVIDETGPTQAKGKQTRTPGRYTYTPVSGIWQTVWLEPVPENHIDHIEMIPDASKGELSISIETRGGNANGFEAIIYDGKRKVASGRHHLGRALRIQIPDAKLWSPDSPHLYDVKIRLLRDKTTLDEIDSYTGIRTIELAKVGGVIRPVINGKFIYQTGTLDQGYWPDGLFTAPTDDALRFDIELHKRMGFNMVRKHVKVEPQRWYYWADKLGLLVWQDMPHKKEVSYDANAQWERELYEMIREHINSPSIIQWVIFNEGWGVYDRDRVPNLVRKLDPSRLLGAQTGGEDKRGFVDTGSGDDRDHHTYGNNPASQVPDANETPNPYRFSAVGEYGGIEQVFEGHSFGPSTSKYNDPNGDATQAYIDMQEKFRPFIVKRLSATVYTQITDLETEQNGLWTYDRRVPKMDEKRIREINLSLIEEGDQLNK